jgi:hypothetical protein
VVQVLEIARLYLVQQAAHLAGDAAPFLGHQLADLDEGLGLQPGRQRGATQVGSSRLGSRINQAVDDVQARA